MANLPKRASKDHSSHARRARSYAKSALRKASNIALQKEQETFNRNVGTTGKQRDNMQRKIFKETYRARKRQIQMGNL